MFSLLASLPEYGEAPIGLSQVAETFSPFKTRDIRLSDYYLCGKYLCADDTLPSQVPRAGYISASSLFGASKRSSETVKVFQPTTQGTDEQFGQSIAIARDTRDYVIIGAPRAGGANVGQAFVFKIRSSDEPWAEQASLDPPVGDRTSGAQFGSSVAIASDGSYAVVGAPGIEKAYVYQRGDTSWSYRGTVTDGAGAAGHAFGCATAMALPYVVVGARNAVEGRVCAYKKNDANNEVLSTSQVQQGASATPGQAIQVTGTGGQGNGLRLSFVTDVGPVSEQLSVTTQGIGLASDALYISQPATGGTGTGATFDVRTHTNGVIGTATQVQGFGLADNTTYINVSGTGGSGSGVTANLTTLKAEVTTFNTTQNGTGASGNNTYSNVSGTGGTGSGITATITTSGNKNINSFTITNGGVGYRVNDVITFNINGTTNHIITVTSIGGTPLSVVSVSIVNEGVGYNINDVLTFDIGGSTAHQVSVTSINGTYRGVNTCIANQVGSGYTWGDTLTVPVGGGPTSHVFQTKTQFLALPDGQVLSTTIVSNGTGYDVGDIVSFDLGLALYPHRVQVTNVNPVTLSTLSTIQSTIKASGDGFGTALSLTSDGNTLVVSAPNASSGSGNVFVYSRSGDTFTQRPYTVRPSGTTQTNSLFGQSLDLTSAGNVLVASRLLGSTTLSLGPVVTSTTVQTGVGSAQNTTYSNVLGTGGSGTGFTATLVTGSMSTSVVSFTITNGGSGFKVGDQVSFNIGTATQHIVQVASVTPTVYSNVGTVHMFSIGASTFSETSNAANPFLASGTGFGKSVGITSSGDRVLVGAPDLGLAFMYGNAPNYDYFFQVTPPDSNASSGFATVMDFKGNANTCFIGAPFGVSCCGNTTGKAFLIQDLPLYKAISAYDLNDFSKRNPKGVYNVDSFLSNKKGAAVTCISADGLRTIIGAPDDGTGEAFVANTSTGASLGTLMPPAPTKNFGTSVALNQTGTYALVGDPGADRAHVFFNSTGSTWVHQGAFTAPGNTTGIRFGMDVHMDLSGTHAIVGAPYANSSGYNKAGAAYLFKRTNTTWSQVREFTAKDAFTEDEFGEAVSVGGDATFVAIGAPYKDWFDGKGKQGKVYVYTGNTIANVWTDYTSFKAAETTTDDQFGCSVSIAPDNTYLAIGAQNHSLGQGKQQAGQVYVMNLATTPAIDWKEVASTLVASDRQKWDQLGERAVMSGDGNTVVVSSINSKSGSAKAGGKVYVLTYDGTSWAQSQILTPLPQFVVPFQKFGISVATSSDAQYIFTASDKAELFAFTKSGGTYTQSDRVLTPAASSSTTPLRISVACNDAGTRVFIGCPNANKCQIYTYNGTFLSLETELNGTSEFGACVSCDASGTTLAVGGDGAIKIYTYGFISWSLVQTLNSTFIGTDRSMALSSDGLRLAAGVYISASSSKVYVYTSDGNLFSGPATFPLPSESYSYNFGQFVAFAGTGGKLVIGTSKSDPANASPSSQAYVYTWNGSEYVLEKTLSPYEKTPRPSRVVPCVSINSSGTRVAIGLPKFTTPGKLFSGKVSMWHYTTSELDATLTSLIKVNSTNGAAYDNFGRSVAISTTGSKLAVGAPNFTSDDGYKGIGKVSVYDRSGATFTEQSTLSIDPSPDKFAGMKFGSHVCISSDGTQISSIGPGAWRRAITKIYNTIQMIPNGGRQYPPIQPSTDTYVVSGQAYGNGTYTYTASSIIGTPDRNDRRPFQHWITNPNLDPWTSEDTYNTSTGQYLGSAGLGAFSGEWCKQQFPKPVRVIRFTNQTKYISASLAVRPFTMGNWALVGSKNNTTWTAIATGVGNVLDVIVNPPDYNYYTYVAWVHLTSNPNPESGGEGLYTINTYGSDSYIYGDMEE